MEQMLREWRLRHHKRLMAQAHEFNTADGGPLPYKRIVIVAASYLAWGLVVFWALNVVEYAGIWLALLYWLSNPVLIAVAGFRALVLEGRTDGVYVLGGKICHDDYARLEERGIRGR